MFIEIDFFKKPLATIWQFFMTDKPQIIGDILRTDPDAGPAEGPDGVSYTIRMAANAKPREVFLPISPTGFPGYNGLRFVRPEAEGENFYNVRGMDRYTAEPVPQSVVGLIQERGRADAENTKKNFDDAPAGLEGGTRQVRQASKLIH